MLQNFPSQPSLQMHCHGSSHSPLTQPGEVTHWSHRGPSQPGWHLCEQKGERGAHEGSRGPKRAQAVSVLNGEPLVVFVQCQVSGSLEQAAGT